MARGGVWRGEHYSRGNMDYNGNFGAQRAMVWNVRQVVILQAGSRALRAGYDSSRSLGCHRGPIRCFLVRV